MSNDNAIKWSNSTCGEVSSLCGRFKVGPYETGIAFPVGFYLFDAKTKKQTTHLSQQSAIKSAQQIH